MSGTINDGVEIIPMDAPLGAEIRGVDLAAGVTPGQIEAIEEAWETHLVLLMRGQDIDDSNLVAFSRLFGDLDMPNPGYESSVFNTEFPEVNIISNVIEDGKPMGKLGSLEAAWHADMTYNDMPPKAAILHGMEIPEDGGETCFANMYAAYDALSDDLKRRIEGCVAIHDAAHNSGGQLRKGYQEIGDPRETPGARQPMVRTNPRSGRKCLFLGRRPNSYVLGLDVAESDALLDAVWEAATEERFAVCHEWRPGDVLMWDNISVLHRRGAFPPESRRMMHRTQITGTEMIV